MTHPNRILKGIAYVFIIGLTSTLVALGISDYTYNPKAPTKSPELEIEKNYQAPFTRYTTDKGYKIDQIIIGTDTLYGSHDYKTLIHK